MFSLPPLRGRGDDVLELAAAFLAPACADHGVEAKLLDAEARAAIAGYRWPGNVRELANVMDRVAMRLGPAIHHLAAGSGFGEGQEGEEPEQVERKRDH